jgi:glucose-1-phosphate thymidylyltransferase
MRHLGIILAAGQSTRLYPATLTSTKQLLPVYDKPLIYYPLTTLMLADIRDFIIIVSPNELNNFQTLFKDAKSELGINIRFLIQESPTGIADAFNIISRNISQEELLTYDNHVLILGDNIYHGAGLQGTLTDAMSDTKNAHIFLYPSKRPEEFGVAEVKHGTVVSLEEKPKKPKSNLIVTGLYVYPPSVYMYAALLLPSKRGELEITDLNNQYLYHGELKAVKLLRGTVWFDTGNADAMLEASNFIQNVQKHQNYLLGSPHEIAINNKWVTQDNISPFISKCIKTEYGKYLYNLLQE